jgi:serine/threonine protein phosphatase PrpC
MNNLNQISFFEQKKPITIRKLENKNKSKSIAPKRKHLFHIKHQNISSKALGIPGIFPHSIEKQKINISYNIISQRKLKSKRKEKSFNDNTNIMSKKDICSIPANNEFSFLDSCFQNKRINKAKLINASLVNYNNNIFNNMNKYQGKKIFFNKSMYKNGNISTSLPKIKITKNPISTNLNHKEIEKEKNSILREKRAISQRTINYNIQNITKIKTNLANKLNENNNDANNNNNKSQILLNELLNDYYPHYQPAKHSENSFDKIMSYGVNTYKGAIRQYNEDRVTILINANINKNNINNNLPKISLFSIYDGHGGHKCSEYLKTYLHHYILDSEFFPQNPIKAIEQGFKNCENNFLNSIHLQKQILDSSGSCAIIVLIINDSCYIINLGDSRALYSFDDGQKFFQLSRDHKPNDPIEKRRIYKEGGSIYKTNLQQISENSMIGFKSKESLSDLPYRIFPGRLSVSYILIL